MNFLRQLSETVNKLPDAKARVKYLEELLKKEKDKEKRKDIEKLLANAEQELEKEKKQGQKKTVSLEDSLKAPIGRVTAEKEEDYAVLPTAAAKKVQGLEEEKMPEKNYIELIDGKTYKTKTNADELSSYLKDEENRAYLEKMEKVWSSGETPEKTESLSGAYETAKESEEYKRDEQLKEMIGGDLKKKKEEEEYKRKKMA